MICVLVLQVSQCLFISNEKKKRIIREVLKMPMHGPHPMYVFRIPFPEDETVLKRDRL